MRAAVIQQYGPPDVFELDDISRPPLLPHQLLIRVSAASVNPIDWRIRNGSLRFILPARFPLVLGYDVSGVVVDVGSEVREFRPNDDVFCFLDANRHGGGYAEFAVASADVVVRKPANLSYEAAAAVPLAASTALQALRDHGRLTPANDVLINGASGGVGTFAVQIAKALGGRVTAVCSSANVDLVAELGADHVIDYTRDDFTQQPKQYDIVFDAVAKSSFRQCRAVLKQEGTYITTIPSVSSFACQCITRVLSRKRCRIIMVHRRGADLHQVRELIEQGKLRPVIDQAFPMAKVAEAHRRSEEGHVRGKLVLRVC